MAFEREQRDLAFVPRWGIARLIRPQSVAEHSYYVTLHALEVARFIRWPYQEYTPNAKRFYLLQAALWHDMEEVFMSDIPGPSKRSIKDPHKFDQFVSSNMQQRFGVEDTSCGYWIPIDDEISKDIKNIIKTADLIDECFYLGGEIQMGNRAVRAFYTSAYERLKQSISNLPCWYGKRAELFKVLEHKLTQGREAQSTPPQNSDDVAS